MKRSILLLGAWGLLASVLLQPIIGYSQSSDEAQIRALEDSFAAAVRAKDVDAIMKVYVPDDSLFVFDVTPPRQYVGAAAYRKDWEDLLNDIEGPIKFEITDLAVTVDGNHRLQP